MPEKLVNQQSPEDIVGGVWVAAEQRFVAVHTADPFTDERYGFTLHEYEDSEGNVRASLLTVPANGVTPAWHIKRPNPNYIELHRVISGSGTIVIRPNEDDYGRSGFYDVPGSDGKRVFDLRSAMHPLESDEQRPIMIKPGETFQVLADAGEPLQVLAVMPRTPFQLDFEERVMPFFG